MPVVISVIFFVIYYIISLTGEKFAREGVTPVYTGMWLSAFILLPAGIFLTYKAARDSSMFSIETYFAPIKRFFNRFQREENLRACSSMKILQLATKVPYPPKDGGAAGIYIFSEVFSKLGHAVTLLAVNPPKHFISAETHIGSSCHNTNKSDTGEHQSGLA